MEIDRVSAQILRAVLGDEPAPKPAPNKKGEPGSSDHWSPAVLLERAAYLRKMAKFGDGSAWETLKEYPQHCAMLSFRSRSGEAEVHERFADLFVVLAGTVTLVTGGRVCGARNVGTGETSGDSIEGGTHRELRAGEIAHVSAGTPHQMLLSGEETITCLVMKVQEA